MKQIYMAGYRIYIILAFAVISVVMVSGNGLCRDLKSVKSGAVKKPVSQSERMSGFYRQRNVLAGKMWIGLTKDKIEQTDPSGATLPVLQPSNASGEFFRSIDRIAFYDDQAGISGSVKSPAKARSSQ